jgi:hypothetical protein
MPKNRGSHNFVSIVDLTHFSQLILGEKPKPIANESRMAHKKNNEKSNAALPKKNVWFVEFYANFAETCVYTRSLWAEYSRKYDCDELHFADGKFLALKLNFSKLGKKQTACGEILYQHIRSEQAVAYSDPIRERGGAPKISTN